MQAMLQMDKIDINGLSAPMNKGDWRLAPEHHPAP